MDIGPIQELNHHSAVILPYHVDKEGAVHFIVEGKDPNYKTPYFDRGVNFIGGNSTPADLSSRTILSREVREEFWNIEEPRESLNALLGEHFVDEHPEIVGRYALEDLHQIQNIASIFLDVPTYAMTYVGHVPPPIMKTPLLYTGTVYLRQLDANEYGFIKSLLGSFNNKLTPDNLRWDSTIESISLPEINKTGRKFAWGYCNVLNALIDKGVIPTKERVLRPLSIVSNECIPALDSIVDPTKANIESAGFHYNPKNW